MNQTPSETLSLFENISRLWPMLVYFVGALAWLLRVEAKQVYLEKHIKELSDRVSKKDEVMWKALNDMQKDIRDVLQHLAKIEGKLENSKNH